MFQGQVCSGQGDFSYFRYNFLFGIKLTEYSLKSPLQVQRIFVFFQVSFDILRLTLAATDLRTPYKGERTLI